MRFYDVDIIYLTSIALHLSSFTASRIPTVTIKEDCTLLPSITLHRVKAIKAEEAAKKAEARNGRSMEGVMTATDSLSLIRSIRAGKHDRQNHFELEQVTTGELFIS